MIDYQGMPVDPTIVNYYAWSPQDTHYYPKWIDGVYENGTANNYVVYTKDPMKKFVVKQEDHLVRADIGGITIFLIVNKGMWENWWIIDEQHLNELETHNSSKYFSYKKTAAEYY